MLGRNIRGFERARDKRARGSDIDHAAPLLHLHRWQRESHGVERCRQVDGDDRVLLVDRKRVDRCDVLVSGIVDQNIDRSELRDRLGVIVAI